LRAKAQDAIYSDATQKYPQVFPIEIFDFGTMPQHYLEVEIGLIRHCDHLQGISPDITVKGNVYQLPDSDLQSPQLWDAIEKTQAIKLLLSDCA